jgi:hypothetical protein
MCMHVMDDTVLKAVETARAVPKPTTGVAARAAQEEFVRHIKEVSTKHGLDSRRNDIISHFILRLAFCRT